MDDLTSAFTQRLHHIRQRIAEACTHVGREPQSVQLLPVSKSFDDAVVQTAIEAGLQRFGENRLPAIQQRLQAFPDQALDWIMIGHVQSNKAKDIARYVTELHSLDRLSVAEALDRRLQQQGRGLPVLIQLKTAQEGSKTGLEPAELTEFLRTLKAYASLKPFGVMTMATQTTDVAEQRRCFALARQAVEQAREAGFDLPCLSMGMSDDLEAAVAEGSTEVRIGSALFGTRYYA
ncbi:MAG TPA: YggS family pyridoxal phosphate-dependent enzyme [Candidatus Paenalcaligenes intestinipullorum]|uniref:Pyridoxal phosphate homeostasis protein n=1 Tax=Candidatus Paenalcaligenes intestinipullorum TaxID=2838718 RepID=A0A9D2RH36_9BURK|nr:YggS family pyridoxal phosphate-dependent enzyme [Candidatus Paenalcaligenes intestinipullorum]